METWMPNAIGATRPSTWKGCGGCSSNPKATTTCWPRTRRTPSGNLSKSTPSTFVQPRSIIFWGTLPKPVPHWAGIRKRLEHRALHYSSYQAAVRREQAFVLRLVDASAAPARTLVLRGTIDLLVAWPDGSVDVVDYKRARVASAEPYALQLDAYTLAAQELVPGATAVRAGLLFLGGDAAEPSWRKSAGPAALRDQLASLAARLVLARWSESFPAVRKRPGSLRHWRRC